VIPTGSIHAVQGDLIIVLAAIACGGSCSPPSRSHRRAARLAAIDAPSARSSHTVPTPPRPAGADRIAWCRAVVTWSTAMIAFSEVVACSPPSASPTTVASLPAGRRPGDAGGPSLPHGWGLGR